MGGAQATGGENAIVMLESFLVGPVGYEQIVLKEIVVRRKMRFLHPVSLQHCCSIRRGQLR